MGINFDDIVLPDEAKNKPADINLDPETGDPGVSADPTDTPPAATPTYTKPEGDKPEKPEMPEKPEPEIDPEKPKTEEKIADQPKDGEKPEKPADPNADAVPFHKHPDWIKMQKEVEYYKGKVDGMNKDEADKIDDEVKDPYDNKPARQVAREQIRREVAEGKWKPQDQVDVTDRYEQIIEEVNGKRAEIRKKISSRIEREIDDTFDSIGVKDEKTKEKVMAQVNKWRSDGLTGISVKTLKLAHTFLKSTGELGDPATPETATPAPDPAPADNPDDPTQENKQKVANRRIGRHKSGGGGKGNRPLLRNAHKMTLDDMTHALGKTLDTPSG